MLGSPPATFGRMCESFPSSVPSLEPIGLKTAENFHTSGSLVEPRIQETDSYNKIVASDLSCLVNDSRQIRELLDSTGEEISTEAPALESPRSLGGTDKGDI